MRGVVLGIVPDGTYGQVEADDGQRYSFWTSEIRNGAVQAGQAVEFQMWQGQPVEIYVVPRVPPPSAPPPPRAAAAQQRQQSRNGPSGYAAAATARGPAMVMPAGLAAATGSLPGSNYWIQLFTSPVGRISRRQFWLHGVLPLIGVSIVLRIVVFMGLFLVPTLVLFADVVIFLLLLWPQFCISAKRFQDVGYPGWYNFLWIAPLFVAQLLSGLDLFFLSIAYLLYIVALVLSTLGALVALAALIIVFVRAGQQGPNQYGPDPLAS